MLSVDSREGGNAELCTPPATGNACELSRNRKLALHGTTKPAAIDVEARVIA